VDWGADRYQVIYLSVNAKEEDVLDEIARMSVLPFSTEVQWISVNGKDYLRSE
jgi:hypothetical protein